jgi:AcrR family transcriptional regulator
MTEKIQVKTEVAAKKVGTIERNKQMLFRKTFEILATSSTDLSVENFAVLAEVSPASIYKHFESKDSLFSQTVIFHYFSWKVNLDSLLEDLTDDLLVREIVRIKLLLKLKFYYPKLVKVFVRLYSRNPGVLNEIFERETLVQTYRGSEKTLISEASIKVILFRGAYSSLLFSTYRDGLAKEAVVEEAIVTIFSIFGVKRSTVMKALRIPISDEVEQALFIK